MQEYFHNGPFAEQMRQPTVAPRVIEWEQIQIEIQLAAERVVRKVQTLDDALAALDTRVDRLLAKRRTLVEAGRIACRHMNELAGCSPPRC